MLYSRLLGCWSCPTAHLDRWFRACGLIFLASVPYITRHKYKKLLQKYSQLVWNSQIIFFSDDDFLNFLLSYQKMKLNFTNLIAISWVIWLFYEKSTKSQRPFWKKRMETKEMELQEQRRHLFERIEEKLCFTGTFCDSCSSSAAYVIRCNKWREHLCVNCDFEKHRKLFSDRRSYLSLDNQLVVLRPTEFVSLEGIITVIGNNHWPGSLSNNYFFIEEDLLVMWYRCRHKTPGTSEQKFVETQQEILENDRVSLACWVHVHIRLSQNHLFLLE